MIETSKLWSGGSASNFRALMWSLAGWKPLLRSGEKFIFYEPAEVWEYATQTPATVSLWQVVVTSPSSEPNQEEGKYAVIMFSETGSGKGLIRYIDGLQSDHGEMPLIGEKFGAFCCAIDKALVEAGWSPVPEPPYSQDNDASIPTPNEQLPRDRADRKERGQTVMDGKDTEPHPAETRAHGVSTGTLPNIALSAEPSADDGAQPDVWEKIADYKWDRLAVKMLYEGYTSPEIASKIGNLTAKTVDNRLSVLRSQYNFIETREEIERKKRPK
jgi:hypothetical protein